MDDGDNHMGIRLSMDDGDNHMGIRLSMDDGDNHMGIRLSMDDGAWSVGCWECSMWGRACTAVEDSLDVTT
jgi:hypothetical protein